MSAWTHIHALIVADFGHVDDYCIVHNFIDRIKDENYTLLFDMQKKGRGCEITGSEMNATVTAAPCRNFVTDARDKYYLGQVWSISINGDLRDRHMSETRAEWNRFLFRLGWFLKKDCERLSRAYGEWDSYMRTPSVEYYSVDITDGYDRYLRTSLDREYKRIDSND